MTPTIIEGNAVVHLGSCLDILPTLPDNSIDSIVTDPPYGLSAHDPGTIVAAMTEWLTGDRSHVPNGKGFMGKEWDAFVPPPAVWDECLRVLKPGGHLLAFSGSRSYDLMVLAIRLAGFEIRDSIHWTYGSGFPKSLDVSKAIDKAAGAEREKKRVAPRPATSGTMSGSGDTRPWIEKSREVGYHEVAGDTPATPEAEQWHGWGTALKPSHEPIVVARKPLAGTVAANVLAYGTGALNIDGTRVGNEERTDTIRETGFGASFMDDGWQPSGRTYERTVSGRWPANTVLTHAADCQQVGTRTVKAADPDRFAKTDGGAFNKFSQSAPVVRTGNGDGTETSPIFACVDGCPVAALDQQSGNRPGRIGMTQQASSRGLYEGGKSSGDTKTSDGHSDSGGASRFFTTTEWQPADYDHLVYVAKPSKRERNNGLDSLPAKQPVGGADKWTEQDRRKGEGVTRTPSQNFHPTVKPIALMRHLIRLVTPPGGTVLDPFTGSGTTGVAALLEGNQFVGCELTDDYLPIIAGRLAWANAQTRPDSPVTAPDASTPLPEQPTESVSDRPHTGTQDALFSIEEVA